MCTKDMPAKIENQKQALAQAESSQLGLQELLTLVRKVTALEDEQVRPLTQR